VPTKDGIQQTKIIDRIQLRRIEHLSILGSKKSIKMIDFVRWILKNSLYIVMFPVVVSIVLGGIGTLFKDSTSEKPNNIDN
jgi:hypothetical protein